jgi:hypothetical protein
MDEERVQDRPGSPLASHPSHTDAKGLYL